MMRKISPLPALLAGLLACQCQQKVKTMEELLEALDRQSLLGSLFHPRRGHSPLPAGAEDFSIPVPGAVLGARWHGRVAARPSVLFFHGNGETVPDYDDVAQAFAGIGLNLFAVDYRGYGWSTGRPSVRSLMPDAEAVHAFFQKTLTERGHAERPLVMGRSLGSGPASHLATAHPQAYRGLIVESGFGDVVPLLELLGIKTAGLEEPARNLLSNDRKLAKLEIPLLLIHGARDNLIPISHARQNYAAVPHGRKKLEILPDAGHNDLLAYPESYFGALAAFQTRP